VAGGVGTQQGAIAVTAIIPRCGIIGLGRIGRLCAAIAQRPGAVPLTFVAAADIHPPADAQGLRVFEDYRELLASGVDGVLVTTPPDSHYQIAKAALLAGKDVFVEKPPVRTTAEAADLIALSARAGRVLFFAFHAQYNPAVQAAKRRLGTRAVTRASVMFKEDAWRFHPSGGWVFREGALRDSGINAVSVLTYLLEDDLPVTITAAELTAATPDGVDTRARLEFVSGRQTSGRIDLDWRFPGAECREVTLETDGGSLRLDIVAGHLYENDQLVEAGPATTDMLQEEYTRMLRAFAGAMEARKSVCGVAEVSWIEAAIERA
jgi:D-galactose 1-dehydrogenase